MAGLIVDQNNMQQILDTLEDLGKVRLEIGVFAPEGSEMYMIAMVNEYGASITVTPRMRAYFRHVFKINLKKETTAINIPERSFIRNGFEAAKGDIENLVAVMIPAVVAQQVSVDEMMGQLGEYIVGRIHKYIRDGIAPPNAQLTIDRKGSSKPLIDTGRLNQSITYRIVRD